jgi:hypothetical protein
MIEQLSIDFNRSLSARDDGIARTMANTGDAWFDAALPDLVAFVGDRGEATVEQWRFDWLGRGKPAPSSHKSYGALAITAARRGLIVNTRRYVKASAEKTHAHPVPVWRLPPAECAAL